MFNLVVLSCVIASAVMCSVGLKKYAWFVSVGYGLAVLGCGVVLLVFALRYGSSNLPLYLHCLLLALYGARLSAFLLKREKKNKGIKKLVGSEKGPKVPALAVLLTWIMTAFLTAGQVAPAAYRIYNCSTSSTMQWIAFVLSGVGFLVETVSDMQKNKSKAEDSGAPVMTGFYRLVRCPNYFGEMLLWLGVLLSGIGAIREIQWILPIVGWLYINGVMLTGVRRVCSRQNKSYGALPEFCAYAEKTPALIPLLPWYIPCKKK